MDQVREGAALAAAVRDSEPFAATACAGWTVHDVVAHLAAGSEEIAELIEQRLADADVRPTREFEDREQPYRDLPDDELRTAWDRQAARKKTATRALAEVGEQATFRFTGMDLTAAKIRTHSRSEAAVHRWDIVGDDDISERHLGQEELTDHAVDVLNAMPVLTDSIRERFARAARLPLTIVLRAPDSADVIMSAAADGAARLYRSRVAVDHDALVETDVQQRLLTLWGRRSSRRSARVSADDARRADVEAVLWADAARWPA